MALRKHEHMLFAVLGAVALVNIVWPMLFYSLQLDWTSNVGDAVLNVMLALGMLLFMTSVVLAVREKRLLRASLAMKYLALGFAVQFFLTWGLRYGLLLWDLPYILRYWFYLIS